MEHHLRLLPQVPAELKLAEVARKMLPANMDMGTANRPLDDAPEALDGIRVSAAAHPFFAGVVATDMGVAGFHDTAVSGPFVRRDHGPLSDVVPNLRNQSFAAGVLDHASDHITSPLDHAEHDGFAASAAPAFPAGALAADVAFVRLDNAVQARVAVHLGHVLPYLVAHAPGRLVGDAKLTLQLHRGDAVPRRDEQVHGVEPLLERRAGQRERRVLHGVDVMAAIAGVSRHLAQTMPRADLPAFRTGVLATEAHLEQVVQASVIVREAAEEVGNGERASHVILHPYPEDGGRDGIRQGDNRANFFKRGQEAET